MAEKRDFNQYLDKLKKTTMELTSIKVQFEEEGKA